ncbi:hypothetical protein V500_06707 [Pseudogymnoascus sp. VKM F-4518 (FW-2643)]|nr:hypothetical protein V500_06707 [Pseudogymnoascus sp. VKM F-4518 (FW-2643)]
MLTESFRPERWLDADEKQVRMMDRSMLAVSTSCCAVTYAAWFGQGTRGCVGKHVAMMALTKTVGQIVRVFDMGSDLSSTRTADWSYYAVESEEV